MYHTEWGMVGHGWAVHQLTQALKAGRLRHAYLITGPAEIGKTTLARRLAAAVNCTAAAGRPCGQCRSCTLIERHAHSDVTTISANEGTLKIDQVREMVQSLSLRPLEGRHRVMILRRFHEASGAAMDALLKTLEEPPPYVLILITADTTDGLLPTIRSRCQPLVLRPVPPPAIREALITHWGVDPDKAALLAQLSAGRLGWAVRASDDADLQARRTAWIADLEKAIQSDRVGRFALAEALAKNKDDLPAILDLWTSYWRDVLLLTANTTTPIVNRDRRHTLDQIARTISLDDAFRLVRAVRRTVGYLGANVNTRLALEVLTLDIPRLRLYDAPPGSP
ncbi:MAG TPA: DNA polymerase III subunit delta' C-terminal domain-containing protein [Aggregatilineales bacterium]|nr:AAA family ATPase [Anaerolineales bacterium]HRE47116.1 DNA polymerase III subunit delta' C-terminal domain-containing protein [Aggregatilineales bacterium]